MVILRWLVMSKVGRLLMGLLAAVTLMFALIQYGRMDERNDVTIEKQQEYINTQRRINDAETSTDRATAIERLRSGGYIR